MKKAWFIAGCVFLQSLIAGTPTLHVIPHSHWDREWYLPFEQHRLRLVQLMDDVLRQIDADSTFYFLSDGQTIVFDDYLAVRPEQRTRLWHAIRSGRLSYGPQYILPDTYLADAESQVRNHIIAVRDAEAWQDHIDPNNLVIPDFFLDIGYFPDTFGNTAQSPQLLKELGFKYALAGRGFPVDDTGSEFLWQAPDGSQVFTHVFADWYCNGMELTNDVAALGKRLKNGRRFTSSGQFLLMNGCDHQPVQIGLSQVLRSLQSRMNDERITISTPQRFFQAAVPLVKNVKTFVGEARNPKGRNGLGLEEVYSSRLYLKQANWQSSRLLESYAEPLATLATLYAGADYPEAFLQRSWRLLLQNQVHDDICGCSVDAVHQDMMVRFRQVDEICSSLIESSMATLIRNVDLRQWPADSRALMVFNPSPFQRQEEIVATMDFPDSTRVPGLKAFSPQNEGIPCRLLDVTRAFAYELPNDRFRIAKHVTRVRVQLTVSAPSLGYAVYRLQRSESEPSITAPVLATSTRLENKWIRVDIGGDGTYSLLDKRNGQRYDQLGRYEFRSDGGDEYNFRALSGETPLSVTPCSGPPEIIVNNGLQATWRFRQEVEWPAALLENKKSRGENGRMPLITELTLYQSQPRLDVRFKTENRFQDYRLRVQLPTSIVSATVTSEGDFGWDTRAVQPIAGFRRDSYSLPQGVFSYVTDQKRSLIVANQGLTEFEPSRQPDGTVVLNLTLLRCVGELGDWGFFPTPEAQCPGPMSAEFSLIPCGPAIDYPTIWSCARPLWSRDAAPQAGSWPRQRSFLPAWPPELVLTAVKKAEKRNTLVVRGFNHTARPVPLPPLQEAGTEIYYTNLLEQRTSRHTAAVNAVGGCKIFTVEAAKP